MLINYPTSKADYIPTLTTIKHVEVTIFRADFIMKGAENLKIQNMT